MANGQRKQTRPIGPLIKAERQAHGWSQRELAALIGEGMTREYLAQIEGGTPKWPQLYIAAIARELGKSQEELARYAGMIDQGARKEQDQLREELIATIRQIEGERDLRDLLAVATRLVDAQQVTRMPRPLPH